MMSNNDPYITVDMALNLKEFDQYDLFSGIKGTDRKIKWVHIVELASLETTFNGGELILTTGKKWISKEKYAIPFLNKIIQSNCACLCIELHTDLKNIPEELFNISEKHDFPIIIFHNKVKFMDISKSIYDLIYSKTSPIDSILLNRIWGMEEDDHTELSPIYNESTNGIFILIKDNIDPIIQAIKKTLINVQIFKTYIASVNATLMMLTFNNNNSREDIIKIIKIKNNINRNPLLISPFFTDQTTLFLAIQNLKSLSLISREFKFKYATFYNEVHLEKILYLLDHQYLEKLTDEYLGPIIAFDKKNKGELTLTLKTLIELNGNRKEAAAKLFISRQAIYYRIEMIKDRLGIDFDKPSKKAMLEILLYNHFKRK